MHSVISIGHDIVEIERIKRTVQKYGEKFLQKVYVPEELHYCLKKSNPFPSLAARFAAKEATAKAFACGIGVQFSWQSASIINRLNGSPEVRLDALGLKLLSLVGGSKVILSLTHTHTIASAVIAVVQ
ncbi:MAG: holo-ACP synthase [Puniceicoccales bacterium]|jgi:holo-[acyl-carrier protein] synthase|nr:holo-ACP synthase [Puniceicoccales bacterium]